MVTGWWGGPGVLTGGWSEGCEAGEGKGLQVTILQVTIFLVRMP